IIEIIKEDKWGLLVNIVIDLVREAIKLGRGKIAILVDEAFHLIGYEKSALYVKALLGVIEYPPASYEKIIAVVATSEGLSREEIGRHLWAEIRPMWNMSEKGFKELYKQIPGDKPSYEDIWRVTGGNPRVLGMLYNARWSTEEVVRRLIIEKKLNEFISGLAENERRLLREALDDPDVLMSREGIPLMKKLVKANLIVDEIPERDHGLWIDTPPPERDTDLGIGRYVAWQTPLHKEAVRRVLMRL
ncbi:MAG: ATP-binding protein, partial [Sulfolobales archaeon]